MGLLPFFRATDEALPPTAAPPARPPHPRRPAGPKKDLQDMEKKTYLCKSIL